MLSYVSHVGRQKRKVDGKENGERERDRDRGGNEREGDDGMELKRGILGGLGDLGRRE